MSKWRAAGLVCEQISSGLLCNINDLQVEFRAKRKELLNNLTQLGSICAEECQKVRDVALANIKEGF